MMINIFDNNKIEKLNNIQVKRFIFLLKFILEVTRMWSTLEKFLPHKKLDWFHHDKLMRSGVPYYMLAAITGFGILLHYYNDNPFTVLWVVYTVIPLLDEIFTIDTTNPTKQDDEELLRSHLRFQIPIYVTILVDWATFFYALHYYQHFTWTLSSLPKLLAFLMVIIHVNAAQFAVAHELMHKPGIKKVIGTLHMLKTLNIHFTHEHVLGHHRRVATAEDPASASKGTNICKFFLRSYFGAYREVYLRDKQLGKPVYQNTIFLSLLSSTIFCGLIWGMFGTQAFLCFLVQVTGAVFFLEAINYIEHYGLRRKKNGGEYEKVTFRHSWNSAHRFSNYLFFKLQRHSDHHENAMKPYQTLLTVDDAPQLPHGYVIMNAMAMFPATFFSVMDPLVECHNEYPDDQELLKERYRKSVQLTRHFILKLSFVSTALFCASRVLI